MTTMAKLGLFLFLGTLALPLHVGAAEAPIPSQTIHNLNTALEGEANASHRYAVFSKKADDEGHHEVARLFRAISKSESIHRANHQAAIRQLGGTVKSFKLQKVKAGTTEQNLKKPIEGEKQEESEMYPKFIEQARRDNAPVAVETFAYARDAELQHERLLKLALDNLGHNRKMTFFVNSQTGATISRVPGVRIPASEDAKGKFLMIK